MDFSVVVGSCESWKRNTKQAEKKRSVKFPSIPSIFPPLTRPLHRSKKNSFIKSEVKCSKNTHRVVEAVVSHITNISVQPRTRSIMADVTDVFEIELHEGELCEEEDDDIIDIIDDVSFDFSFLFRKDSKAKSVGSSVDSIILSTTVNDLFQLFYHSLVELFHPIGVSTPPSRSRSQATVT